MSLSSFLTQAPVNYGQSASQTSSSLPSWYTDYTQGILNNAAQFANQGYQAYQGPQVAGPTADQQASYGSVSNTNPNATAGITGNAQARGVAQGALGQPNAAQAANPYLSQANAGIRGALQGPNALGASQPYMGAAQAGVNKALSGPNGVTASSPYLQNAGQPLSSQMGQFMNPYINDVVNATNKMSSRNFNENVMPGLQDQFTRAGQVYGGTRQGEFAERMGRDEQLNQQMTDASLLSSGFNTALGGAQAQAGINAGLGATAGSLANATQGNYLQGANINSGLAGTAANAANAAQGNALYGSGLTAGLGSTAGSLANASQQTGLAGAQTIGGLSNAQQANALGQATLQNQMGTQQQQQTQNNYNTQYQNFQNQTQFPALASQVMGSALQGIQVPSASTNYQSFPIGQGPTGFQNIAGGIGLGTQLGNVLNSARGGSIQRYDEGGPVHPKQSLSDAWRHTDAGHLAETGVGYQRWRAAIQARLGDNNARAYFAQPGHVVSYPEQAGDPRDNPKSRGGPAHVSFLPNVRPTLGLKMRYRSPLMAR